MKDGLASDGNGDAVSLIHIQPREPWRRYADDLERVAVQLQGSSKHAGIASEIRLPEGVTDHRDRSGAAAAVLVVFWGEHSSQNGGHSEHAEEIAADPYTLGKVALASVGQVEALGRISEDSGERLLAIAVLAPMPSASERTAAAVNPRWLARVRMP